MAEAARTGRRLQRYEDAARTCRLLCGAVPVRAGGAEVLLIRSGTHGDWLFPKGGWEEDESAADCATREVWEEAGVRGHLLADALPVLETHFVTHKGNRRHLRLFLLAVDREFDAYPESERERKWMSVAEARQSIVRPEMKRGLEAALAAL